MLSRISYKKKVIDLIALNKGLIAQSKEGYIYIYIYIYIYKQYWDTLPPLSLKKYYLVQKNVCENIHWVLFYALMLIDINLINLFASLVVYS